MKTAQESIREIFSILANICFPTINNLITKDIRHFLNQVELIIDNKEFSYLTNILAEIDFSTLEKKYDNFNIKLVEFTFLLYEEWLKYVEEISNNAFEFIFCLDKSFIDYNSEKFFKCLLNKHMMNLFSKLKTIENDKTKILNADIIKKYKDNVIQGTLRNNDDNRIKQIFKVVKENFFEIDADKGLFVYIEEYQEYCLLLNSFITEFEYKLALCKEEYLQLCMEVFSKHLYILNKRLVENNITIDKMCLKLHILDFIKKIMDSF